MNKTAIRAYLIEHPDNKSAFQAFVDRFTSEADSTTYPMAQSSEEIKEVDILIQQKLTEAKSN